MTRYPTIKPQTFSLAKSRGDIVALSGSPLGDVIEWRVRNVSATWSRLLMMFVYRNGRDGMTFSHSTLVRLAGNAMIEMFRHADGFDARMTRGSWCIASGAGHPLLNWIAVFEPGPSEVIAFREAVSSLRSRGLPGFTFFTPDTLEGIEPVAQSLGLGEPWQAPMMLADLADLPTASPVADIELIEIDNATALDGALALTASAFDMPSNAAQLATTPAVLGEPGTRYYTATRRGETLSMCVISQFGSLVYVDLMASSPQHQKQGIGRALLTRALQDHIAAGATHAFLIASQEGVQLYSRLGFKHLFDGTMYNVTPTIA
jgi:GNAT superfamily N-acetyltransferase